MQPDQNANPIMNPGPTPPPQAGRVPSPPSDQFSQTVERLKQANNVLVTVRTNPTVDQLAACIGLTLALNKQNKHASAVFSGEVPSTIEFLEPEKTIETNTDSLRDFIISLDKSKADKLRYKVEDQVVKIFITPYKTSISDQDLDFSQGDFNIDAVIALGVHDRAELDQAILAHGRILHDATVISVNTEQGPEIGAIHWLDQKASSLCEMMSDLVAALDKNLFDSQIATAFLTGVVAETDRFRNEKSSPHTMSVSGVLMAAGASTQLVASKLEEPVAPPEEIPEVVEQEQEQQDGTIEIDHTEEVSQEPQGPEEPEDDIHIDREGQLRQVAELLKEQEEQQKRAAEQAEAAKVQEQAEPPEPSDEPAPEGSKGPGIILEPPKLGGQLTANSVPEHQQYGGTTDPMSAAGPSQPTLSHAKPSTDKTLSDIEESLKQAEAQTPEPEPAPSGPDVAAITPPAPAPEGDQVSSVLAGLAAEEGEGDIPPPPPEDYARDAVERAVSATDDFRDEPMQSLGANPLGLELHENNDDDQKNDTPPPPPVPPPLPPQ